MDRVLVVFVPTIPYMRIDCCVIFAFEALASIRTTSKDMFATDLQGKDKRDISELFGEQRTSCF